jgi:hypothetical protein
MKLNFKQKLKYMLWKYDLCYRREQCPFCNKKIIKHGFENDLSGEQFYSCEDDKCILNKDF